MMESDCQLILDLLRQKITEETFRGQFHPELPSKEALLLESLTEGFTERNSKGVQFALIIGDIFGFPSSLVPLLCQLLDSDWHMSHESIVSTLDELADIRAVPFLEKAAMAKYDYLAYDSDTRVLAYKAIWALSKIGDPSSLAALQRLANSSEPVVSQDARERLAEMNVSE